VEVHKTIPANNPRAFGTFGSVSDGQETILFTFGGLRDGFHATHTFKAVGGDVESVKYQVSGEGQVYYASQVLSTYKVEREHWSTWRPTYSHGNVACCNYDYSCNKPDRGIGCVPVPRAFHSTNPGHFLAGKLSMILYGGLDRTGKALGDLWYMDAEDQTIGKAFWIVLSNTTAETFSQDKLDVLMTLITTGWGVTDAQAHALPGQPSNCDTRSIIFILKTENVADLEKGLSIVFTTSEQVFQDCMRPVMSIAGALEAAVNGSVMQGVRLDIQIQTTEGVMVDVRMPWYQFRSNEWCKEGKCARALCQSTTGEAEKEANSDRYKYCYDDINGDGTNDYSYSWSQLTNAAGTVVRAAGSQCGADYFCAAPGKRHGQSAGSLLIEGDATMLVVVGGENADWDTNSQSLTMDVHLTYFTSSFATWAKVLVPYK